MKNLLNPIEIVRDIEGFSNYTISNDGKIYSKIKKIYRKCHYNPQGYLQLRLKQNGKNENICVHRLVAEHFLPNPENKRCIDHIDKDKKNNNMWNLRWCTNGENMSNRGKQQNNTSGFKGVTFNKERNKWQAQIQVEKVYKSLGRFDTKEKAYEAYCDACIKYHKEFAHF